MYMQQRQGGHVARIKLSNEQSKKYREAELKKRLALGPEPKLLLRQGPHSLAQLKAHKAQADTTEIPEGPKTGRFSCSI